MEKSVTLRDFEANGDAIRDIMRLPESGLEDGRSAADGMLQRTLSHRGRGMGGEMCLRAYTTTNASGTVVVEVGRDSPIACGCRCEEERGSVQELLHSRGIVSIALSHVRLHSQNWTNAGS